RDSLLSTYHFLPTDLYAGGDPTTIPPDLRPYFNLRRMQVTVTTPTEWCKTANFTASATGVTITSAVPGRFLSCQLTVEAATGEVGIRDLTLTWKVMRILGRDVPFTVSFPGAVDLATAVPAVRDFLAKAGEQRRSRRGAGRAGGRGRALARRRRALGARRAVAAHGAAAHGTQAPAEPAGARGHPLRA